MNEKAISIPVEKVSATEDFLVRFDNVDESGLSSKYLNELKSSDPTAWPPIAVVSDGASGYLLIDGYHRLTAAKALKLKAISAIVLPEASFETAFNLNREHGLHLTTLDRRQQALRLHKRYPNLSERELARRAGLDHATVGRLLRQGGEIHHPKEAREDGDLSLPIARARAARRLLHLVSRLSRTRGIRATFNETRAIQELATAIRQQVKQNPDFQYSLKLLKAIVDAATSVSTTTSKNAGTGKA